MMAASAGRGGKGRRVGVGCNGEAMVAEVGGPAATSRMSHPPSGVTQPGGPVNRASRPPKVSRDTPRRRHSARPLDTPTGCGICHWDKRYNRSAPAPFNALC